MAEALDALKDQLALAMRGGASSGLGGGGALQLPGGETVTTALAFTVLLWGDTRLHDALIQVRAGVGCCWWGPAHVLLILSQWGGRGAGAKDWSAQNM
jgi:hypothetical protein